MELPKRKPTGREKDESAIKRLEQLRQKLHFGKAGRIRRAAGFQLSWMQEDGLEILKEALFGDFEMASKTAAAYGLRNMQGRMKKQALEVFKKGLKHSNNNTREVAKRSLALLKEKTKGPDKPSRKGKLNPTGVKPSR